MTGPSWTAELQRALRPSPGDASIPQNVTGRPGRTQSSLPRQSPRRRVQVGSPELQLEHAAMPESPPPHLPCRREANDVHDLRSPTPRCS
ncbi:hypothetical protein ACFPM0_02380 [Pseudonocardia sulfidoxydans]|uniref:hypothetical protein n=1 Tax=Pseudonocardia sulfidoxydans TaxID=54011 RepID=UPI003617EE4F